jgi:hypothetical protein
MSNTSKAPVNRSSVYQLEHYLFALTQYVTSVEFKEDIKSDKQQKILREIGFITMAIDILKSTFLEKHHFEKKVVGWEDPNPYKKEGYLKIYYFSCIKVAGLCTGSNTAAITSVCKNNRKKTNGWVFKYREDWEQNEKAIEIGPEGLSFEMVKL